MLRRDVLRQGIFGAAAAALTPGGLHAGQGHGCYEEGKFQVRCQVGFPNAPFIEPQACRTVCWANCIAYILRGYGAKISVETIVRRLNVPGDCRVRDDSSIIMGASGHWRDDAGRAFLVKAKRYPNLSRTGRSSTEFQPLVNALSAQPLIVGQPGHSSVLTEMTYVDAPLVLMRQEELTLRDPWAGSPNRVKLPNEEAPESMFAIGLTVRAV